MVSYWLCDKARDMDTFPAEHKGLILEVLKDMTEYSATCMADRAYSGWLDEVMALPDDEYLKAMRDYPKLPVEAAMVRYWGTPTGGGYDQDGSDLYLEVFYKCGCGGEHGAGYGADTATGKVSCYVS